jgi:hypothetical protein
VHTRGVVDAIAPDRGRLAALVCTGDRRRDLSDLGNLCFQRSARRRCGRCRQFVGESSLCRRHATSETLEGRRVAATLVVSAAPLEAQIGRTAADGRG